MFNISRVLLVQASIIENTTVQVSEIGTEFWSCFCVYNTLMRLITCRQGFPFLSCSSQITENCNIEKVIIFQEVHARILWIFPEIFIFSSSLITVRLLKSCNSKCYEEIINCRRIKLNTYIIDKLVRENEICILFFTKKFEKF